MSKKRTSMKVPRLSLSVTLLEDPDYWGLIMLPGGHQAFACFVALCLHCKRVGNQGRIQDFKSVLSRMIGFSEQEISEALAKIKQACEANKNKPWAFETRGGMIVIRNFSMWNNNGWGGARPGSGRPELGNQDGNQDESSGASPTPTPSPTPSNTPLTPLGGGQKKIRLSREEKQAARVNKLSQAGAT